MILGMALGDAMGLVLSADQEWQADGKWCESLIRGYRPGDWGVDTDQAVVSMQAFISAIAGRADFPALTKELVKRLHDWALHGNSDHGDTRANGLSGTLAITVKSPEFPSSPNNVAVKVWNDSGRRLALNGSMVRAVPMSCVNWDPGAMKVGNENSPTPAIWAELCSLTHADPRVIYSYTWFSQYLAELVAGITPANAALMADESLRTLDMLYGDPDETPKLESAELKSILAVVNQSREGLIDDLALGEVGRSGYATKALSVAAYTSYTIEYSATTSTRPSFEKIIKHVASAKGTVSTNCAIAGAILGAYLGEPSLAKSLLHYDWLSKLIDDFIAAL